MLYKSYHTFQYNLDENSVKVQELKMHDKS
jgi:hypothetical protein